ncbi:MAG: hypothetical protein ACLFNI_05370 [Natronomonas sp.]
MRDWRAWLTFEFALVKHSPTEWILLTGDRLLVSLLQFLVLLGVLGSVTAGGYVPYVEETPILFLLFALIAANFTLIAIVTSLSQLVLSQRLQSPGEIRTRMAESISYREDVGETIGQSIMPIKTDAFFLFLFENARSSIETLRDLTAETRTRRTRDELSELLDGLDAHTEHVVGLLEHPASGLKHALFTSLNTNYENHVHRAWYLQMEYTDEYTDLVAEPLGRLTETLQHIVVASRMFQATFIESEVSELSRFLLYVGIPVQIAGVVVMLLYTAPGSVPVLETDLLRLVLPVVIAAGFSPFLILTSYIVRLTVVARRTADNYPFSSQLEDSLALRDSYSDRD